MLGLLPAEEAAIRKALRESLKTAATEKCQDELSSSSDSSPSPSPKKHTGSKRRGKGSQSKQSAKRMKLKEQKDSNSTLTTFNGGTSTKSPSEHVTCKSPARLSMPPTCISDSSPVISDSASLKLMLSSSSDSSSSSSPFSSHQDSSTTSKKKLPKKTAKKSPKPKKVLLAEFSTPVKQKAKPLKGSGGRGTGSKSLKRKKNEDECIGEGASEPKIGKTKQHVVHGGVLSKGKAVKGKRTTPGKKNQKKMSKILADSIHVGSGLSSTLTSVNCPDIQDYATTESGIGDFGSPTRATCIADDSMEDYVEKQEQQKTTTFTWYEHIILVYMYTIGVKRLPFLTGLHHVENQFSFYFGTSWEDIIVNPPRHFRDSPK